MADAPKVFVIDAEGKPCLPTHPARARKLLREGKATVEQVVPYTIRLKRVIEDPVGSFTVGIDDGAKTVGIAIVNEHTREVVFKGEVELRQDVSRKVKQRAMYRRTRRGRKLRHRPARFLNRKQVTPFPSIRQRKDSIIRFLKDMSKKIRLTKVIVEEGMFDTSSLSRGHKLEGKEYQIPGYTGRNFRAKVLWRDRYICQHCKSSAELRAHHIRHRAHGGTDTPHNGITLCESCHTDLHDGKWELKKKPKQFIYPTWLMQGKIYLQKGVEEMGLDLSTCVGWMTSYWRQQLGLDKSHSNDAIAVVCRDYMPAVRSLDWSIKPRRAKIWDDNPTKTCEERNGFRHYDVIKAAHRTRGFVVGSVRSLKSRSMILRTSFDPDFPVSYRKSKLLQRFSGLIYTFGDCCTQL